MGSSDGCCGGPFLAFLSLVTVLVYSAAVANPYWLEQEYAKQISLGSPIPPISVDIESHIGAVWACTNTESALYQIDKYKCESLPDIDSDIVEDWQWAAAGMAVVALILTYFSMFVAIVIACKNAPSVRLRVCNIFCYFIACVLMVASVVLFYENTDIKINHDPEERKEYDFDWGYYVAVGCAGMSFIMTLLNLAAKCCISKGTVV